MRLYTYIQFRCIYAGVYVCMYVYIYICIHIEYTCIRIIMCICLCMYIYTYVCTHACMHVCMYVCTYVKHMHHITAYTYTYTDKHTAGDFYGKFHALQTFAGHPLRPHFLGASQRLPVAHKTYLVKELHIETIIRNPKR